MTYTTSIRTYFVHVAFPLLLGCCLYVFGRPLSPLMIDDLLRLNSTSLKVRLPNWIVFNLPDGLWLYCFLMWLIILWHGQKNIEAYCWFLILIVIAFGSEVLQKFSLIHGTFDILDILAYCIALLFCAFNYYHQITIPT